MSLSRHTIVGWAEENGKAVNKGRVTKALTTEFLTAHPERTRALAVEKGIEVGKRGRITAEVVAKVADTLG